MLYKNEQSDFDNYEDPWEADSLNRQKVAKYLTPLLAGLRQPFVIGLHSSYGTGKTHFLRCWRRDLSNQGFHVVCFNAWETDFSDDPLFAFMAALKKQLAPESSKEGEKKSWDEKCLNLSKKCGVFAWKKGIPLLAKAGSRLLLGEYGANLAKEEYDTIGKDLEKVAEEVGKEFSSFALESLNAQEEAEKAMTAFRKDLESLVAGLVENKKNEDHKKVIIFIDELDRCRPDYAVSVLETIKHFFQVPGLAFLIAVDDDQLRNAIASVYGPKLDGEGYLRRFIDWRFQLPEPSALEFTELLFKRFSLHELSSWTSQENSIYNSKDWLKRWFSVFAEAYKLSLREMEQCFVEINVVLRTLKGNESPLTNVLGPIVVMRLKCKEKIKAMIDSPEETLKFFLDPSSEMKRIAESQEMDGFSPNQLAYIHSWFVDNKAKTFIKLTIDTLSQKISKNPDSADEERKQLGYMKYLQEHCGSQRQIFNSLSTPLASIVLERLTGASVYSKQ